MGRTRRLLALTTLGAIALPPLAAAIVRSRYEPTAEDDDELRLAAIFDGLQAKVTSTSLRRGEAIAWYGGLDVDLRGASLDPGGARLRVVALFAGVRVIVPSGWNVVVRPVAVFGGIDARVEPPIGGAPRLTIDAVAAFAGVQVMDRPPEDEQDVRLEPSEAGFARAEAEARVEAAAAAGPGAAAAPAAGGDTTAPADESDAGTTDMGGAGG